MEQGRKSASVAAALAAARRKGAAISFPADTVLQLRSLLKACIGKDTLLDRKHCRCNAHKTPCMNTLSIVHDDAIEQSIAAQLWPLRATCCRWQHDVSFPPDISQRRRVYLIIGISSSPYIGDCGNGGSWWRPAALCCSDALQRHLRELHPTSAYAKHQAFHHPDSAPKSSIMAPRLQDAAPLVAADMAATAAGSSAALPPSGAPLRQQLQELFDELVGLQFSADQIRQALTVGSLI